MPSAYPAFPFLAFSNETILDVAENLDLPSVNALLQTNRFLRALLDPLLDRILARDKDQILAQAARKGYEVSVSRVLAKRPDLLFHDDAGFTALHHAVAGGWQKIVDLLLDGGADIEATTQVIPQHSATSVHTSPFLLAVRLKQEAMVQHLAKRGANIFATDEHDWTALHYAAGEGLDDTVKFLLSAGIDINVTGSASPAITVAARSRHKSTLRILLDHWIQADSSDPSNPGMVLHIAALYNWVDSVKALLAYGVDVDTVYMNGILPETALLWAIRCKNAEMALLLFEHGADIYVRDGFSQGILALAVSKNQFNLVKAILERGIDLTRYNSRGHLLLQTVAQSSNVPLAKLLFDYGLDFSWRDHHGGTPLHYVVSVEMAEFLAGLGVAGSVNDSNMNGETVLEWAIQASNVQLVEWLLKRGAQVDNRYRNGTIRADSIYWGDTGMMEIDAEIMALLSTAAAWGDERVVGVAEQYRE